MNLKALAGHTIDLDALPEFPLVLDVGCRGFDFTSEIRALRPHSVILALDPDPSLTDGVTIIPLSVGFAVKFANAALVGGIEPSAKYASFSTGEGNFITDLDSYYDAKIIHVMCTNISRLMRNEKIAHFHVVKLDCEGSEFGILENWPGPIADQISVEFHDSGYTPGYGPDYDYTKMFERLAGFGYRVVKHDLSKQGEGIGHWDSLIVL